MFRQSLRVLQEVATKSAASSATATTQRTKLTTGLTGIAVHSDPLAHLRKTYDSVLSILSQMPEGAVYRQSAESIIREKKAVVDRFAQQQQQVTEGEIEQAESEIGEGQIEQAIIAAEDELRLAAKMLEWKPWEELVEEAPRGQWAPFSVTPSTTTADDLK